MALNRWEGIAWTKLWPSFRARMIQYLNIVLFFVPHLHFAFTLLSKWNPDHQDWYLEYIASLAYRQINWRGGPNILIYASCIFSSFLRDRFIKPLPGLVLQNEITPHVYSLVGLPGQTESIWDTDCSIAIWEYIIVVEMLDIQFTVKPV